MISFSDQQISPPKDWQAFERLCLDLWKEIWKDPNAQVNGRSGQQQDGVDIYGQIGGDGDYVGVQCKLKDLLAEKSLSEKELRKEVNLAKNFHPKLSQFTIATTCQNDAKIQKIARIITSENKKEGLFSIYVWSWDEIQRELAKHPNIQRTHFGNGEIFDLERIVERTLKKNIFNSFTLPFGKGGDISIHDHESRVQEASHADIRNATESGGEDAFGKQINEYRGLIEDKPKTAIYLYKKLLPKCLKDGCDESKFKILNNIGAAYFRIGINNKLAAKYFLAAKRFSPKAIKAKRNEVLSYLLLDNPGEALRLVEKVIELDPLNPDGYALKIAAMSFLSPNTIFEELVSDEVDIAGSVAYAIGNAYRRNKSSEQALSFFKLAYESDSESDLFAMSYAEQILEALFGNQSIWVGNQISNEDKNSLKNAKEILKRVWGKARGGETQNSFLSCALNLVTIYMYNRETEQCKKLLDELVYIAPSNISVRKRAALFEASNGNHGLALEHISEIKKGIDPDIDLIRLELLFELGNYNDALSQIDSIKIDPSEQRIVSARRALREKLFHRIKDRQTAVALSKRYIDEFKCDIYLLTSILKTLHDINEENLLNDLKILLISRCETTTKYSEKVLIAEAFFDIGMFIEASKIYKTLVEEFSDSPILRRLLICLFNCDHRSEFRTLIEKLPIKFLETEFYIKILCAFYTRVGDLKKAESFNRKYLEINPNDIDLRFNLLRILQRQNRSGEIMQLLGQEKFFSGIDPLSEILYAGFLQHYGFDEKAISIAYRVLRNNYRTHDIHSAYIHLILSRNKAEDFLYKSTISVDSAFEIISSHGEKCIYIVENNHSDKKDFEIGSDHPIYLAAQGKVVGDKFTIKRNPFQEEIWEISSIKSKYIHMMHRSMKEYSTLFPDQNDLWAFKIAKKEDGESDFSPIFSSIDERASHIMQVKDLYKTHSLPFGIVANLLGITPIDAWRGFLTDGTQSIKCCIGTQAERDECISLMEQNGNGYVIEPLTLYNIYTLSLLDKILQAIGPIAVTQSSLDLLLYHVEMIKEIPPSGFLGKSGKHYILEKYDEQFFEKEIQMMEDIRNWVIHNCEILPAIGRETIPKSYEIFKEAMDECL
ncbi:Tetratricopeptide domain protein [Desulfatibacillum aliphaticivorans]|uniref:Tetratricopeptide domain protein n=1 Tax=Desulfatibacillum aliphaticivorans TaxID=218208 RepID=B8FCM6_DESAL|nr:hypothetical protein [Desulfatibacillum aliphaticivorans]ACL06189.1 Tetratricopeptide domain protein [Desulfatibacillum aliphaticivorans]